MRSERERTLSIQRLLKIVNKHESYILYALGTIPFEYWVICVLGPSSETHMVLGSTHDPYFKTNRKQNMYM